MPKVPLISAPYIYAPTPFIAKGEMNDDDIIPMWIRETPSLDF
jgi:hypothetical protein